ncbi:MAG TPA: HAD-IIIC family phosphatase [Terriglobales bacterium]|nr:HAD-IIIC family phosphatase [Terriglobales bacterium]
MQPTSHGISIRIAANFTVEPIEEFLAYWIAELGIRSEIRFAPYNQVFQQLLEGGLLRTNTGGVNLVALDLDAWLPEGPLAEGRAQLERTVADLISILRVANSGVAGAVLIFPPFIQLGRNAERAAAVAAARTSILEQCATIPGWSALDLDQTATLYAVSETRDPFTDELGNIPFTEEMYVAAATAAARWIRAALAKPRKVIVLDCDNTLWQGICGEGTMQVTPPYRRLQQFMLEQRERGMLLAMVSKNNEADVLEALESKDCLLRPEHFASWQINWKPKSENLALLSEELGLAPNSFIFVDDNAYECMEVRNSCPEVLTIPLPSDPDLIPAFLEHMWVFDRRAATEEDRNRAAMYEAERQRTALSKTALTAEEFLASLQIEIQFAPVADGDLARVAQLTQRTTQFNMTGVLHTEQSLKSLLSQGTHECWTVRVRDVFGDYGLVGVALFKVADGALRMEIFLMSCRALGRRVEHQIIEKLKRLAIERGADRLVIPVVPTARNRPAREFLASLCGVSADAQDPFECVLSATSGSSEWRPAEAVAAATAQPETGAAPKLPVLTEEEGLMVQIASEMQSASSIVNAIRHRKKPRPANAGPLVPPRSPLEKTLVQIWSDCLGVEPIGIRDNFFDFGGQSLRATRVLTRVRAELGVELSLTALFKTPTIEAMAAGISEMAAARS